MPILACMATCAKSKGGNLQKFCLRDFLRFYAKTGCNLQRSFRISCLNELETNDENNLAWELRGESRFEG